MLASEEEDVPVSLESADLYKHTRRADVVVEEGNKVRGGGGDVGRVQRMWTQG